MEYLIKQIRLKTSGKENLDVPGSTGEQRAPLRKTASFTGEKKRPQNWLGRQFSRQMSRDFDSSGVEQAAAIAAAAYAITKLEESGIPEKKYISEDRAPSFTRTTSKRERKPDFISESDGESRQFSGEGLMRNHESPVSKPSEIEAIEDETPAKVVGPAPSIKRTPTSTDKSVGAPSVKRTPTFPDNPVGPAPSIKRTPTIPDNLVGPAPSIKKTPTFSDTPAPSLKKTGTFADELLDRKDNETPGSVTTTNNNLPPTKSDIRGSKPEIELPQPRLATLTKPVGPVDKNEKQQSTVPGSRGTKADVWERAELAKIKERYEKLNARILSYENKRKAKARQRLDRTESNVVQMRSKALEKFRTEMADIDQIVLAARAKAAQRQKNEVLKAKSKANKIRETGTIPKTCFCF